jgi:hypothetical protein
VAECDVYQCKKGEIFKSPDTLQPLPIPHSIWQDIYMDLIMGLPKSDKKIVIMVVVDLLSKYAHLCELKHLFTASTIAHVFMDNISILHGMPHSIVHQQFLARIVQDTGHLTTSQHHLSSPYRWPN